MMNIERLWEKMPANKNPTLELRNDEIKRLRDQGISFRKIGKRFGISDTQVIRILKAMNYDLHK